MTRLVHIDEPEAAVADREGGLGALSTERGNLPLESIEVAARITGLVSRIELTQGFHNPHDVPLEATYIFPLPERAAVTAMRLTAADRTVNAELKERAEARAEYDRALAAGQRAAIAEEERPDVFTMRVGNILPGERVTVALTLIGPLSYEDNEATFRLPLVVAPRYIPGTPTGSTVGDGYAPDTDAVPDASRITPPVLLPGFPNPVRLSISVDVDPGGLPLSVIRSTLHAVQRDGNRIEIQPGERVDRDFILRLAFGDPGEDSGTLPGGPDASVQALTLTDDLDGDGEGTFRLTILPPTTAAAPRPRDVVLVLDRSGSMSGWKMVAARRAASRIVDTLTATDRFAVIAFDDRIEHPSRPGQGMHPATDRNRYAAVEFLSRMDARGGTELLAPLTEALGLLTDATRDRVVVLVTDGQLGNEDQILERAGAQLAGVRVHTVGIDRAVNAGFLGRLAAAGGGRCELVESEDRLDEAMDHIHRRIGAPVVTDLRLELEGLAVVAETVTPARLPGLFPGTPLVVTGRYRTGGRTSGAGVTAAVTGRTRPGQEWSVRVPAVAVPDETVTAIWARAHLRDLEDRYASLPYGRGGQELERRIVATSLRHRVLCRFTAWVAVDERVVTEGGTPHRVVQPVELPSGWDMPVVGGPGAAMTLTGAVMPAAYAPRAMSGAIEAEQFLGPTIAPSGPPPARTGRPGGLADRIRRAARPAPSAPATTGRADAAPVSARLRQLAGREAQRLRDAADAPEYERRELLADLGTRLAALTADLDAGPAAQSVRSMVAELAEDRLAALTGADLAALWDRVLALLDALAAGTPPEAEGGSGGSRPFWKR